VPGVGAQGGDADIVLEHGRATSTPAAAGVGGGLLVNVSRGIAGAARESAGNGRSGSLDQVIAAAARDWAERLPVLP
jgi:hypothetical protein